MYGKDLIESATLSGKITRLMGKEPPVGFFYEMFLDEEGKKISKSKGKGLTVDTWMNYAPIESLLYYIYQNPRKAKRLHWNLVPRCVDEYLAALRGWPDLGEGKRLDSVLWHIFECGSSVPVYSSAVNFTMVNNLLSAIGTVSTDLVMEYLVTYDPTSSENSEIVEILINKAMTYYRDFIVPLKKYKIPDDRERRNLLALRKALESVQSWDDEHLLQSLPFDVAKTSKEDPPELFRLFYQVILGQERGPRFGSFARLLGKEKLLELFDVRLSIP
jgi:lysyl-tRNA synthetase class 1